MQQLENENDRLRNEIERLKLREDGESGHLNESEPMQKKKNREMSKGQTNANKY